MEAQQQVRSPTPGNHQDATTHTPSPGTSAPFANDPFASSLGDIAPTNNQMALDASAAYITPMNHDAQPPTLNQHTFLQAQNAQTSQFAPPKDLFATDLMDANASVANGSSFDAQFFPTSAESQVAPIDTSYMLDPQLLDPQAMPAQSLTSASLSAQMAAAVSSVQSHSSTSPNIAQNDMLRSSPSGDASSLIDQGVFDTSARSRHASLDPSMAAFPPAANAEWASGAAFNRHRRKASDNYSDVSSSAVPSPYMGTSDNFDNVGHISPLLVAQQDQTSYQDVMQFGQFSLSEAPPSGLSPAHSPSLSPQLVSDQQPLPQFTSTNNFGLPPSFGEGLNGTTGMDPLMQMSQGDPNGFIGQADQSVPPEINIQFAPPSRQPSFEPERVDTALSPPPSSGMFHTSNTLFLPSSRNANRLSTGRGQSRNRALSDPFVSGRIPLSRHSSSGHTSPIARPSLVSQHSDPCSLSPLDIVSRPTSRSSSPRARPSRSSSTSSIPRDYFISLADPTRQPSVSGSPIETGSATSATSANTPGTNTGGARRTQKHPANFSCHICPKRFTRAYNLRSHLRTHTDERPFVCSVCGKAFARQHDRKRHEGLHSGEKKFVCRGTLKDGGAWGCSRRFARADALGRHFRSEAGRVCIRPLLEEESAERANRAWEDATAAVAAAAAASSSSPSPGGLATLPSNAVTTPYPVTPPPPAGINPAMATGAGGRGPMFPNLSPSSSSNNVNNVNSGGSNPGSNRNSTVAAPYALPAALLAQIPALAGIQWDSLPPGPPDEMEGDLSGRSSFDAGSSGGEWIEDDDDGGGVDVGVGVGLGGDGISPQGQGQLLF